MAVLALYDELWSGIPVVAAPGVEQAHAVDHAQYTLWVFAVPMFTASLIEAPIAFVSDRVSRRALLAASLGALAASLLGCALARSAWLLAVGLTLAGAASGVACSAAQAELVCGYAGGTHRAMSRWTAFAAVGDVLAPLLMAAVLYCGGTHRAALGVLAGALGLQALLLAHALCAADSLPEVSETTSVTDAAQAMSLRAALASISGARKPLLWLLLFAASSCTLLDEVIVALAALRLHLDRAWSEGSVAAAMSGLSSGVFVGALLTERLVQRCRPATLLIAAGACSASCIALFICATAAPVEAFALFMIGVSAAPNHALVMASAYELAPRQPGLVNALAQVFVVVEVVTPLVVGGLASRYGLGSALAALALEPLIVVTVAMFMALQANKELRPTDAHTRR